MFNFVVVPFLIQGFGSYFDFCFLYVNGCFICDINISFNLKPQHIKLSSLYGSKYLMVPSNVSCLFHKCVTLYTTSTSPKLLPPSWIPPLTPFLFLCCPFSVFTVHFVYVLSVHSAALSLYSLYILLPCLCWVISNGLLLLSLCLLCFYVVSFSISFASMLLSLPLFLLPLLLCYFSSLFALLLGVPPFPSPLPSMTTFPTFSPFTQVVSNVGFSRSLSRTTAHGIASLENWSTSTGCTH